MFLCYVQGNGEEIFRMGRSTGRDYKEKGVSLHRDKEISTAHEKVLVDRNFLTLYWK